MDILLIIFGAVIGAITTYLASYLLEKKKWVADAALLRKEDIYAPIYDELSLNDQRLREFSEHDLTFSINQRFEEWEKIRNSKKAFDLPKNIRSHFEEFASTVQNYNSVQNNFIARLKSEFPEEHAGFSGYAVALIVSEKMRANLELTNELVIKKMENRQPANKEFRTYWTIELLNKIEKELGEFEEWQILIAAHQTYLEKLSDLHGEVGKRIERITKKYQSASPRL